MLWVRCSKKICVWQDLVFFCHFSYVSVVLFCTKHSGGFVSSLGIKSSPGFGFCFHPFPLVKFYISTDNLTITTTSSTTLHPLTHCSSHTHTHTHTWSCFLHWDRAKLGMYQKYQCDLMSYSLEDGEQSWNVFFIVFVVNALTFVNLLRWGLEK